MAKVKPECPSCGSDLFRIRQTFSVDNNCHYLERKRYAYYKCEKCGCMCLLTTPQGKIEIIKHGQISYETARMVLSRLSLDVGLADIFKAHGE